MNKLKALQQKLEIDDTFSKSINKNIEYNVVKEHVPLEAGLNYQADLLFLPYLTLKKESEFKYLLTIVDIGSDAVDFVQLVDKNAKEVLEGMKTIFTRRPNYLKLPQISMRVDDGDEFKSEVLAYLKKNNILVKVSLPGKHVQTANVENLNRIMSHLLNGFMGAEENRTGKVSTIWVTKLDEIRKDLNEYKSARNKQVVEKIKSKLSFSRINQRNLFNIDDVNQEEIVEDYVKPKFKIGQLVHVRLQKPKSNLGEAVYGENFREMDLRWNYLPSEILDIYDMNDSKLRYRYKIKGINSTTFRENELMKSKYKEMHYEVLKVWKKVGEDYLIQFKGELKRKAGYYNRITSPELSVVMDDFDNNQA